MSKRKSNKKLRQILFSLDALDIELYLKVNIANAIKGIINRKTRVKFDSTGLNKLNVIAENQFNSAYRKGYIK